MRRKINPRALRIMVTMIACIITFKVAAVVSSADALPGVEYRACQTETGWTKWVRNAVTCGDIKANKKLEAVKLLLTDTTDGNICYKVYEVGNGWSKLESNGGTVGGSQGIQAIKIAITGDLSKEYKLVYRVHVLGGDWSDWKKAPQAAGDESGTSVLDGLQAVLIDKNGSMVTTEAEDYSKDLSVTQGQEVVTIQETEVVRGDKPTTNEVDNQQTNVENNTDSGAVGNQEETQPNTQEQNDNQGQNQANESQSALWASKLIKVAKEEVNYSQEGDGTTKYGRWWANKVSDNAFVNAKWSSMFLAWCGDQAGLSDEQYGYYACSEYWKNWFNSNNAYHTRDGYTPKAGDMIFMDYDGNGESDHNGLVIEANSSTVVCIEGNVEGVVKQTQYELSNNQLLGYGTPLFDKESDGTGSRNAGNIINDNNNDNNTNVDTGNVNTNLEQLSTPVEGIDVSTYNTITSWSQIASSTNFAYIRVGLRDTSGSLYKDSKFDQNIKGANAAGIPVGIYFYTQAITTQEAIEEAEFVLDKVKNYNVKYPIAIDSEKSPSGTRTDSLSKTKRTEIIKAFMDRITQGGYKAQVYSGKCYFYEKFDMDMLSGADIWVAHYYRTYSTAVKTDFKYPFSVWQYSDRGSVSGIRGNVDKNVCYVKY